MAYLVPTPGEDPTKFSAVDEHGTVLAEGHLEIELIPGATRHGTVSFVTTERDKRPHGTGDQFKQALLGGAS